MKKRVFQIGAAATMFAGALAGVGPADAQSGAAFSCDPGFYQVIAGQLNEFQPGTGYYQAIGPDYSNYNAMGYRMADGYVYAISGATLYRIDGEGTRTELTTLNVPSGHYTGDFGDDGLLHISRGGRDWHKVDVDTFAATAVPELSGSYKVADVANVHGKFYGISSRGRLYIFDPVGLTVTDGGAVSGIDLDPKAFGAAWSTAGGNLYAGRNSGEIYQITGFSTGTPVATHIAQGPSTNSNDGTSCPVAQVPAGLTDVDGPEPETPPQTPEAISATQTYIDNYETISETFVDPAAAVAATSANQETAEEAAASTTAGGAEAEPITTTTTAPDGGTTETSESGSTTETTAGSESTETTEGGGEVTTEDDTSIVVNDAGIGQGAACEPTSDVDRLARVNLDNIPVYETETVLFNSGFDGDSITDFQLLSGNWSQEGGKLNQLNACGFDYTALLNNHVVDNFRLEATFSAISNINHGGLVFNQSAPYTRSGAMIVDMFDDGTEVRWGTYNEQGYHTYVGSVDVTPTQTGENVTLMVEVRGTQVDVYYNGQWITQVTSENAGGMVGLVATRTDIAFDSMTLTGLPPLAG